MTREELKAHCERQIEGCEMWSNHRGEEPSGKIYEEHKLILELLKQDESYDFARWVAEEIFDEMWEYNKDAFEELACRKLAKLGIVRAKDGKWELIDPYESEVKEAIEMCN